MATLIRKGRPRPRAVLYLRQSIARKNLSASTSKKAPAGNTPPSATMT